MVVGVEWKVASGGRWIAGGECRAVGSEWWWTIAGGC